MRSSPSKILSSLVGASLSLAVCFGTTLTFANDADKKIVTERRNNMKEIGKNMKVLGAFMKEGAGGFEDVEAAAMNISKLGPKITSWFPKGSSMEDILDPATGAKIEIWQEWDAFEKIAMNVEGLALNVAIAAKTGDKGAVGAALGGLGKNTCGACHKPYKEKLD